MSLSINEESISPPIYGPYDSNVTMLYRWAKYFQVPIRFIVMTKEGEQIRYENVTELMQIDIEAGHGLLDVFTTYVDLADNLSLDDICFIYYMVATNHLEEADVDQILRDINYINIIRMSISVSNKEDRGKINKIVRNINAGGHIEGDNRYLDLQRFELEYDNWQYQIGIDIAKCNQRVDQIDDWHHTLADNEVNQVDYTNINPSGSVILIRPLYNDGVMTRPPSIDDGIDIFNRIKATYFTPFIQYNNQDGEKFFKLLDSNLDFEKMNIAPQILRNNKNNHLYITLWYQKQNNLPSDLTDPNVIRKSPTMFFRQAIYDLENNTLKIDMPNNTRPDIVWEEDLILRRLSAGVDCLEYVESKEVKTKGYFDTYNVEIEAASFLHLITTDSLFSSMLYIEERLRPISIKHQIVIHFREVYEEIGYNYTMLTETKERVPIAEPNVSLTVQLGTADKISSKELHNGRKITLRKGTPLNRFVINGGAPSQYIMRIISVISVLLGIYQSRKDSVIRYYLKNLGDDGQDVLTRINGRYHKRMEDKNVEQIITKKTNNRDIYNYQSILYDPSRPKKVFEKKIITSVIQRAKVTSTATVTDMTIEYGIIGKIPRAISSTLDFYRDSPNNDRKRGIWEFYRQGTIRSPSSFLHCVCTAIKYHRYMNIDDVSVGGAKENVIQLLRSDIAAKVDPSLLRQELYDLTDDQIRAQLADPNVFLDPVIFYRAIEEFFLINVYLFGYDTQNKKGDMGHLIVPRCKYFHIHPPRYNRPTVIIYRHWGSESNNLVYPQCELIVDHANKGNKTITLFDINMTEHCHQILTMVSSNITWLSSYNSPVNVGAIPPVVDPYLNIYNEINYLSVLGIGLDKKGNSNLVSQYIDPNGKARAFTADYNGIRISYVTIPAAPENTVNSDELAYPSIIQVDQILHESTPTARSINNDGLTDGIWFKMFNLDEGVYVPIEATDELPGKYDELPIGSINPLLVHKKDSQTKQYQTTVRVARFIKEIIHWLYEVYRSEVDPVDPNEFCNMVLGIRAKPHKDVNSNYISLFNLPRRLPVVTGSSEGVTSLDEALIHIGNYSDVVKSRRFRLHNKEFFEAIKEYVIKYDEIMRDSRPMIFDSIDLYYEFESDFTKHPGTLTFIGTDSISQWLGNIIISKEHIFNIRTKLDLGISGLLEPRVYVDPRNLLWMIQNPYGGSLAAALAIAEKWKLNRVNTGPHTPKLEEIPAHYVYAIGESGNIIAVEDNTNGSDIYLNVIRYTERRYGALLPLI